MSMLVPPQMLNTMDETDLWAALGLAAASDFVAALQAYIFVVLTAVYLSLSIEEEH